MKRTDEVERKEFLDFIVLRERLCAGLEQVSRLQDMRKELLERVQKLSDALVRLQERHKGWKVGDDVKTLAAKAGMKRLFAHVSSEGWPRYGWLR